MTIRSNLTGLAASLTALALTSTSAQAVWTLLDNFNSYTTNPADSIATQTGGNWSGVFAGTGVPDIIPATLTSGNSAAIRGGTAWRGIERDLSLTPGATIEVGEIQTFFYQYNVSSTGGAYDVMLGLSPSVANIDETNAWQDHTVQPFINNAATTPFINSGDGDFAALATGTLYNLWVVVNNDATAPTYDVYQSTGTADGMFLFSSPFVNTGLGINVPLNAMAFMAAGGSGSTFEVDNIYFTTGQDTTFAIPEPSVALLGGLGLFGLLRRRRS